MDKVIISCKNNDFLVYPKLFIVFSIFTSNEFHICPDIKDMQQAAAFRGGKCLSKQMVRGDLSTQLEWQCAFGRRFKASPRLVLLGGHWCPECFPMPWNYDEEAKRNPFFAQVWKPLHKPEEHNVYDESIIKMEK